MTQSHEVPTPAPRPAPGSFKASRELTRAQKCESGKAWGRRFPYGIPDIGKIRTERRKSG